MKLDSTQQALLQLLAWLALQCGQPRRAVDLLELHLQLQPGALEARRMLLVALLRMGDGAGALAQCAVLRGQGEQGAPLWLCQSQAYQLSGQPAAAREAYEYYLKLKVVDEQVV
ncbi:type III secretion protein [Pseudomonas entomophila]|uniref:type III secretion apparatus assembly chaperone SctY n=1 Tax=Pseudomonas entomophila TaxID=312306 RepID=UPI001F02CD5F|nr:type III secretion protein [Pseudomonas entomophila]MCG8291453.1 type III secretion protein [Pseudomonas entomophila]